MEFTTKVAQPEYLSALSMGMVPGARAVQIQGINPDIDTATLPESTVPFGGLYPFQAAAQALQAVSTSADDSAAGLGVRTILVQGLGNAHEELNEVVTMNGLTPVALVNQYRRINGVTSLTVGAGTTGTNVGTITIQTTIGAIPQAQIPIGYGRNQCCIYTVPAGYNLWVIDGFASLLDVSNSAALAITFQFYGRDYLGPWISRFLFTVSNMTPTYNIRPPVMRAMPPGADLTLRVTNASASNLLVTATLNGFLTPV